MPIGATSNGLVMAPIVPQPASPNDIVGVSLQNVGPNAIQNRIFSFGQFFTQGQVKSSDSLVGRVSGSSSVLQVQMDPIALWPDGSVKHSSLSLMASVSAKSSLLVLISKAMTSDPIFSKIAVNLASSIPSLTVTLNFSSGLYAGQKTIDLGAALAASLATASADYWQKGPLLTQARVDVPVVGGFLHLTADVTARADGTFMADVQFNNDLTTIQQSNPNGVSKPILAPIQYSSEIRLNGTTVTMATTTQDLYTNWHTVVDTLGELPMNVQHDMKYLQRSGAILPYDLSTGVIPSLLANLQKTVATAGFRAPLATNGVTTYMPQTGGRDDIGFTTLNNATWLVTQDICAAAISIAQSDAGGAVPWNLKLPAKVGGKASHWLTPDDDQSFWTEGGAWTNTLTYSRSERVFTADTAHQPNLSYVPYLMTGVRWHLDRLNAQAAFGMVASWTTYRCLGGFPCNIVINGQDQMRAQAWTMREIQQAAFTGKTNSIEQIYFSKVVEDNWSYVQSMQAKFSAIAGEAKGYIPTAYGTPGSLPEWQQDYFTGAAAIGALLGSSGARQFIQWQKGWLTGRFLNPNFNPHDGCTYNIAAFTPGGNFDETTSYKTWADIAKYTKAIGQSNGTGWANSNGNYCAIARGALGAALTVLPGDPELTAAFNWLSSSGVFEYLTGTTVQPIPQYYQGEPTFNIVPLK